MKVHIKISNSAQMKPRYCLDDLTRRKTGDLKGRLYEFNACRSKCFSLCSRNARCAEDRARYTIPVVAKGLRPVPVRFKEKTAQRAVTTAASEILTLGGSAS